MRYSLSKSVNYLLNKLDLKKKTLKKLFIKISSVHKRMYLLRLDMLTFSYFIYNPNLKSPERRKARSCRDKSSAHTEDQRINLVYVK